MDWSVWRGGREGGCTCDKDRREWTGLSGGEEGGWELHVIKMENNGLVCLEGRKGGVARVIKIEENGLVCL